MHGGRATNGIGDLAYGIVAHIEVAETSALYKARGEGREEVVREGKPGEGRSALDWSRQGTGGRTSQSRRG